MTPAVRIIEERDRAWLRVVLDRPPGNLLSLEMVQALAEALSENVIPQRKWLTFEGAGEHFSYGAQIQEHVPGRMEQVLIDTHALFRQILAAPCATAALVQGRCLGGAFELALACDMVIATEDASIGLPEINIGAFPPAAAALLPPRIGSARAAEAMLTGLSRPAAEWRDAGALAVLLPRGRLAAGAGEWFDAHLAPRSVVAIAAAAEASRLTLRAAAEPALANAERLYLDQVLPTADASEGVRAFLEKRPAHWKHR